MRHELKMVVHNSIGLHGSGGGRINLHLVAERKGRDCGGWAVYQLWSDVHPDLLQQSCSIYSNRELARIVPCVSNTREMLQVKKCSASFAPKNVQISCMYSPSKLQNWAHTFSCKLVSASLSQPPTNFLCKLTESTTKSTSLSWSQR